MDLGSFIKFAVLAGLVTGGIRPLEVALPARQVAARMSLNQLRSGKDRSLGWPAVTPSRER